MHASEDDASRQHYEGADFRSSRGSSGWKNEQPSWHSSCTHNKDSASTSNNREGPDDDGTPCAGLTGGSTSVHMPANVAGTSAVIPGPSPQTPLGTCPAAHNNNLYCCVFRTDDESPCISACTRRSPECACMHRKIRHIVVLPGPGG